MNSHSHTLTLLRTLQYAALVGEQRPVKHAGRILRIDCATLCCLADDALETGTPVMLTIRLDETEHELLGRVAECRPKDDGTFFVRLGMEYADFETLELIDHVHPFAN